MHIINRGEENLSPLKAHKLVFMFSEVIYI